MKLEQALDKVKKLLALSQSSNEHEAAAAMGRAQQVMEKFRIDMAMLETQEEEEIKEWEDPLDTTSSNWRRVLARRIAEGNGSTIFVSGKNTMIVGRASSVSTIRYLLAYCVNEIDRLAKTKSGNGRTWINNYRLGCVDAIYKEIKEAKEKARSEAYKAAGGGSQLIVLDNALAKIDDEKNLAKQEMYRAHPNLRKKTSSAQSNPNARATGQADGAGIYSGAGNRTAVNAGHRRISG